jgi:site-specific recombinase XerC
MTLDDSPLLADFDLYLRRRAASDSTCENYADAVQMFARSSARCPLDLVTVREVRAWLSELSDSGRSRSTLLARRAALGAFLAFLVSRAEPEAAALRRAA